VNVTKHFDRIWRTVVFSGAMLGASLVSAETPKGKPAQKPVKLKVDTVDSVTKELAALDNKIDASVTEIVGAKTDADRQMAKAKLESQRREKVVLEKKLAELKAAAAGKNPPPPETPISKIEKQLVEINGKVSTAVDAVAASRNDADRKLAKAKLESLRKEKVEVEKKLAAEKAKLKRPRSDESDKPIGRGFVLA
jgi:hypothetical protein